MNAPLEIALKLAAALALASSSWAQSAAVPADPSAAAAAAARQAAEKKSSDWEALARALDPKIQRMLPCDPRVKQSIDEVRAASDARLVAVTDVLRAAIVQAQADSQRARDALAAEEGNLHEANLEHADTDQERVAVSAEAADLKEASKRREGFEEALKKIGEISGMTDTRTENANRQVENRALLSAALRDLIAADQRRQDALDREQLALSAEAAAWSQYYAARMTRADTECSVTGAPPAAKPAPKSTVRRKKR